MPGVRKAKIDFDKKEAYVEFDASKATIDKMDAALKTVGFSGSVKSWPQG